MNIAHVACYGTRRYPLLRKATLGDLLHKWSNIEENGGVPCTSLIPKSLILLLLVVLMAPFFLTPIQPGIPYYSNST